MVVLPTAYAPSVAYMSYLLDSSTRIEAHEYYQKQTYRNRCAIVGAEGVMKLSIPVLAGSSQQCPIQSVQIAEHDNWRHKHWYTIETCYGSSPYYEYYAPDLAPLYLDKAYRSTSLYQHNQRLITRICQLIRLPYQWQETEQYVGASADLCSQLLPPITTASTATEEAIASVPYYQVFAGSLGFVANLSILDLLFNMGPESLLVLRQLHDQLSDNLLL